MKRARQSAGITQAEMAEVFGIRIPTVSYWETGSAQPRFGDMQAYAILCGVTLASFFGQREDVRMNEWKDIKQDGLPQTRLGRGGVKGCMCSDEMLVMTDKGIKLVAYYSSVLRDWVFRSWSGTMGAYEYMIIKYAYAGHITHYRPIIDDNP